VHKVDSGSYQVKSDKGSDHHFEEEYKVVVVHH
jgi:hypothetical protein